VDSTGKETVIHNFEQQTGYAPAYTALISFAGNFYGTTTGGGTSNNGVVFRIKP
jgi:uncharacterized repeat protein (TIGR03803 family)